MLTYMDKCDRYETTAKDNSMRIVHKIIRVCNMNCSALNTPLLTAERVK